MLETIKMEKPLIWLYERIGESRLVSTKVLIIYIIIFFTTLIYAANGNSDVLSSILIFLACVIIFSLGIKLIGCKYSKTAKEDLIANYLPSLGSSKMFRKIENILSKGLNIIYCLMLYFWFSSIFIISVVFVLSMNNS